MFKVRGRARRLRWGLLGHIGLVLGERWTARLKKGVVLLGAGRHIDADRVAVAYDIVYGCRCGCGGGYGYGYGYGYGGGYRYGHRYKHRCTYTSVYRYMYMCWYD